MQTLTSPHADLLPPLSADETEALRIRIRNEGGIHDPVLLSEDGEVLDGHNRLQLDPDAPTKVISGSGEWTEAQRQAFVIRCNLGRRNLSHDQRKEVLRTQKRIAKTLRDEGKTQSEVAELLGVHRTTITKWECGQNVNGHTVSDCRLKVPAKSKPEIARRVAEGIPAVQVAADLKVSERTVRRIVNEQAKRDEAMRDRAATVSSVDLSDRLLIGDFREVGSVIPDLSVDLIFTDPPYLKEFIPTIYADLSAFAARVLRPGGWCLAYAANVFMPDIMAGLGEHLTYGWQFACLHRHGQPRFRDLRLFGNWKPILGFYKPPKNAWWEWFADMSRESVKKKDDHEWQQSVGEAQHYIRHLCPVNGIVCDPFFGSGTTAVAAEAEGRRWVGCEIDEATAGAARGRICSLQKCDS